MGTDLCPDRVASWASAKVREQVLELLWTGDEREGWELKTRLL